MDYAQGLVAQSHREFVHHVRYSQIICKPSVPEHRLDIAGLYNDARKYRQKIEPSSVIIQRIFYTAPLTAATYLAFVKKNAQLLLSDAFLVVYRKRHFFAPPCIFFISILSTNACTRVRICPTDELIL